MLRLQNHTVPQKVVQVCLQTYFSLSVCFVVEGANVVGRGHRLDRPESRSWGQYKCSTS